MIILLASWSLTKSILSISRFPNIHYPSGDCVIRKMLWNHMVWIMPLESKRILRRWRSEGIKTSSGGTNQISILKHQFANFVDLTLNFVPTSKSRDSWQENNSTETFLRWSLSIWENTEYEKWNFYIEVWRDQDQDGFFNAQCMMITNPWLIPLYSH